MFTGVNSLSFLLCVGGASRSPGGDTGMFCTSLIEQAFAEEENKRHKMENVSHLLSAEEMEG